MMKIKKYVFIVIVLTFFSIGNANCQNYRTAINFLNDQIDRDAKDPELYYNRGVAYYYLDDIEKSILDFNSAIRLDSTYLNAYYNLGIIYQEMDKFKMAIYYYDKVLKIDSVFIPVYERLGEVFIDTKDFPKAVFCYSKVLSKKDDSYLVRMNRGVAFQEMGKYEKSITDFLMAEKLNHESHKVHFNIAYSYLMLEDMEECKKHLDISFVLEPNNMYCNYYYAIYYQLIGDDLLSCKYYNRALELGFDENNIEIRFDCEKE